MTTIFQFNYTSNNAPSFYKRTFLGRSDVKDLDIKECLKSINDIHDFNIIILSKSNDIFELDNISVFNVYISNSEVQDYSPEFIKIGNIYIKNDSIITNTIINENLKRRNEMLMERNENITKLNEDVIKLREMGLEIDDMANTLRDIDTEENRSGCNIM